MKGVDQDGDSLTIGFGQVEAFNNLKKSHLSPVVSMNARLDQVQE